MTSQEEAGKNPGNEIVTTLPESFSKNVFDQRTSTGSGIFAILGRDFDQIVGQIVSMREKILRNTNLVPSRHIKSKKGLTSVLRASLKNAFA